MKINKMQWSKPELLVLTRSNPEETVLATCKYLGAGVTGPTNKTCGYNQGGKTCDDSSIS